MDEEKYIDRIERQSKIVGSLRGYVNKKMEAANIHPVPHADIALAEPLGMLCLLFGTLDPFQAENRINVGVLSATKGQLHQLFPKEADFNKVVGFVREAVERREEVVRDIKNIKHSRIR